MSNQIRLIVGGAVIALLALVIWGRHYWRENFSVRLPEYPAIEKVVWLDQNWSTEQRQWFHFADQGTVTFGIPYEWFMALEQPTLSFTAPPGLVSDPGYLDRFGFIPGSVDGDKHALPIGFAQGGPIASADGSPWVNPQTKVAMTGVGLTCAGCHTGRLSYKNTTVLIDGGSALTNLYALRNAVPLALVFARYVPFRFGRFADRVLGPGATEKAKSDLRTQLDQVLAEFKRIHKHDELVKPQSVDEGYARLDALNRIGNMVFAIDLNNFDNYVAWSAPVHFPRIWNAPWFTWVQYNGAVEQPMVRNAGEALGVGAPINLIDANRSLYTSGIQVKTLFDMERLVAGKQPDATHPFSGLNSPKWPADVLPPIDEKLAGQGAKLYAEICQACHLAPVTDAAFWASERWLPANSAGERYLDLEMVPIKHVGTDSAQAEDMMNRKVSVPAGLGINTKEFAPALGQLVENTVTHWYDGQQPPVSVTTRDEMNGHRDNGARVLLAYKVRSLNGIWATPPYLHNGSVPNLYALLSPVAERPRKFYLGNREYDPVNVGYRTDKLAGGFEVDTSIKGNSNAGHEFVDGEERTGRIGRYLAPDERRALVEYLKTL
ncbi:MAG: di-heme-cytochrome C peroxidase [Steroidobacteraceae bacterium]